jgi:hypothetical protein
MSRVAAVFCLPLFALLAQDASKLFQKAPPDVEQALRERIAKFYQLHVDQKFRQAEALVAEDSRDFFYTANKPRYYSFEIGEIEWQDNYTRARVKMLCEQKLMIPGFQGKSMIIPEPSYWKIEDGKWFWYLDRKTFRQTPFGELAEGDPAAKTSAPQMPAIDVNSVQAMVKADRNQVQFKADNTSERVTILNQMPGVVSLNLELPKQQNGVEVSLDRAELKQGEKAVLTLKCAGKSAVRAGLVVGVRVTPINILIPVRVSVL